jgi:hypothetical protein
VDVAAVVMIWYVLGATGGIWAIRKGHHPGIWTVLPAAIGAPSLALAAAARLWVRLQPCPALATLRRAGDPGCGLTVMALIAVHERPSLVSEGLRRLSRPVSALQVVILGTEEGRTRYAPPGERRGASLIADHVRRELRLPLTVSVIAESAITARTSAATHVVLATPGIVRQPTHGTVARQAARWSKRLGVPILLIPEPSDAVQGEPVGSRRAAHRRSAA